MVHRHNRNSRFLCRWLNDGRAESEALLEQRTVVPEGVMDITVGRGSEQLWIDVAIVAPTSACQRTLRSRARTDGSAAKAEEQVKRRRYGQRCIPFVVEAGGRPGASARALLMQFALDEPSLATILAYGGPAAIESGAVQVYT